MWSTASRHSRDLDRSDLTNSTTQLFENSIALRCNRNLQGFDLFVAQDTESTLRVYSAYTPSGCHATVQFNF